MASLRPKTDAMARPGAPPLRRNGPSSRQVMREGPSRRPQVAAEADTRITRLQEPSITSKSLGRIPQASHRRPSNERSDRPPLTHQSRTWTSVNAPNPVRSMTYPTIPPHGPVPATGQDQEPRARPRQNPYSSHHEMFSQRSKSQGDHYRTDSPYSEACSQASFDATSPQSAYDRGITDSPMEIRIAHQIELPQAVTIYPELDRYRDMQPPASSTPFSHQAPHRIATHDLPPPTPMFSELSTFSGSPSTRFSGSPGPGPYSRDTTPTTSVSSQSPVIVAPARFNVARVKQSSGDSLIKPMGMRTRSGSESHDGRTMTLALDRAVAVSESGPVSSSSTAAYGAENTEREGHKKKLSSLPPNPPPRKSSHKLQKSREEVVSPSKAPKVRAQPVMSPSSGAAATSRLQQPTQSSPIPRGMAPRRPSRDGTSDIQSQIGLPVPVVQSNLSSTSLPERRTSQIVMPPSLHRPKLSTSMSEQPRTSSRQALGKEAKLPIKGSALSDSESTAKSPAAARTPSPSVSTFRTRFNIFGRRTKATSTDTTNADKPNKATRKGPAAGTGHEGYGRIGAVRRRSTSVAKGANGLLSSQESLNNSQFHDPFLADRMAPVIIAGGEIVENQNAAAELCRTDSNFSIPAERSGTSVNGSQISLSSREGGRHTLWPSAFPRDASQASLASRSSRRPSDSSDSEALAMKSTLAYRRSLLRLNDATKAAAGVPKPIVTRAEVVSPAITSIDESIMSDDSHMATQYDLGRGRRPSDVANSPGPKKLVKRTRSPRKWNLFGRSRGASSSAPKMEVANQGKPVAATVQMVQQKPVAFYTMIDSSEQEDAELVNIQDVVREARATKQEEQRQPTLPKLSTSETALPLPASLNQRERRASLVRPPAHTRQSSASSGTFVRPKAQAGGVASTAVASRPSIISPAKKDPIPKVNSTQSAPERPSRLPQVGRIPKVVSARPEQVSPMSFSRPFHRTGTPTMQLGRDVQDVRSNGQSLDLEAPPTPDLTHDGSTVTGSVEAFVLKPTDKKAFTTEGMHPTREFLAFSPRQNSVATVATTCSSCSAPPPYIDATAIVLPSHAPLAEDEIWDEYNDLIGEVNLLKPSHSVNATATRVFRRPDLTVKLSGHAEVPLESPTINLTPAVQSIGQALQPREREPPTSSIYSTDAAEAIKESLESGPNPSSPFDVSKFVDGYTDRGSSAKRKSDNSSTKRASQTSARVTRQSNASGSSQGSEDGSPLSQVNLRVGSMTVSKWLTFGHVMFSPVRDELNESDDGSLKRQSVLVLDGLGNDDWSFYAAETYPAATFFNLSPRAPLPAGHRSSMTFPLSPSNHHQVQHTSLLAKVPYSQDSFTSVVLRFPVAAPEAHYRNIISEAWRVLKPGGYIELSILDVDLNNSGNHGRRAVRRLKERIHAKTPDVSLGSTSDLLLRLLGRKGFVDLKTCRVGIPVASTVAQPLTDKTQPKSKKDPRSLTEMMSDESPVADESITKMVAKVGRWWYSRCYETAATVTPNQKDSLWNDRALLAECEEWGTSFKLMVCHARVPEGRVRLASI